MRCAIPPARLDAGPGSQRATRLPRSPPIGNTASCWREQMNVEPDAETIRNTSKIRQQAQQAAKQKE